MPNNTNERKLELVLEAVEAIEAQKQASTKEAVNNTPLTHAEAAQEALDYFNKKEQESKDSGAGWLTAPENEEAISGSMTLSNYESLAQKTACEKTSEAFLDRVQFMLKEESDIHTMLDSIRACGYALNHYKRFAFYGSNDVKLPKTNFAAEKNAVDTISSALAKRQGIARFPGFLQQPWVQQCLERTGIAKPPIETIESTAATLHAVVGIATELAELIDAIFEQTHTSKYRIKGDIDWVNVAEELGDMLWYVAEGTANNPSMKLAKTGLRNINKLASRHGDSFSRVREQFRNLDVERKVLEGEAVIPGSKSTEDQMRGELNWKERENEAMLKALESKNKQLDAKKKRINELEREIMELRRVVSRG